LKTGRTDGRIPQESNRFEPTRFRGLQLYNLRGSNFKGAVLAEGSLLRGY